MTERKISLLRGLQQPGDPGSYFGTDAASAAMRGSASGFGVLIQGRLAIKADNLGGGAAVQLLAACASASGGGGDGWFIFLARNSPAPASAPDGIYMVINTVAGSERAGIYRIAEFAENDYEDFLFGFALCDDGETVVSTFNGQSQRYTLLETYVPAATSNFGIGGDVDFSGNPAAFGADLNMISAVAILGVLGDPDATEAAFASIWESVKAIGDMPDSMPGAVNLFSVRRGLPNVVDGGSEQWVDELNPDVVLTRIGTAVGQSVLSDTAAWMDVSGNGGNSQSNFLFNALPGYFTFATEVTLPDDALDRQAHNDYFCTDIVTDDIAIELGPLTDGRQGTIYVTQDGPGGHVITITSGGRVVVEAAPIPTTGGATIAIGYEAITSVGSKLCLFPNELA